MKKTLLLIGLFILSLSTILTSCDDDDEPVILTNNVITIGDAVSPITSVTSKTENDDTFIIINTDAMELILEFNGKQSIPTGTCRGNRSFPTDYLCHRKGYIHPINRACPENVSIFWYHSRLQLCMVCRFFRRSGPFRAFFSIPPLRPRADSRSRCP